MERGQQDMLTLLVETHSATARIEQRLDSLVETVDDHEDRIRSNERWRLGIPGALLAAIASLIGRSHGL